MIKLFVFSISCVLFLSGCSGKKNESRRTKMAATKPGAGSAGPVVEIKTEKDDKAQDSDTHPTKKTDTNAGSGSASQAGAGSNSASVDTDSVVLPPPGEPTPERTQNPPAQATPPAVAAAPTPAPAPTTANSPAPVAVVPAPAVANSPTVAAKPEGQKSAADTLLVLNFEETKNLILTMQSQLDEKSLEVITTRVVSKKLEGSSLSMRFEGNFEKPVYSILSKSEKVVEFKDFSFLPGKLTKVKADDYNLLGICVGAKCEVIFVAVFKIEGEELTENYPAILKWTGDRYVPARNMDATQFAEELQKQSAGKK